MILKNFWYVAELSSAINHTPKHITLLGQDFVLYRNTQNQVVALNNLCPHRGGALSGGWVEGNCIRCPYHGWKYQSDGVCIEIPANPPNAGIPKLAHVDSYPTQEKYGWVWVFLGDLPESERPPFPPLPEFGGNGWKAVYGEFKWNAPYTRVVENSIDIAHPPFVHSDTFGNQFNPQRDHYELDLDEWGGSIAAVIKPPPQRGIWKFILRHKNRPDILTKTTLYMPNITRLDVDFGAFKFILFNAHVPIDAKTTVTKWIQLRTFLTHPLFDRDARKRPLKTFLQDQQVVESQRPELLPATLSVHTDTLPMAYRKLLQKCLDKGWGIRQHLIQSDSPSVQRVVIPSPVRRQAPEMAKAWERREGGQEGGGEAEGAGEMGEM
ncbi:MAG: aromatic ring-hydroxylating dioxygenase subunit alpha [Leptolyngbyaceae cyanobacterium MO_188.B28]|nr:aromatic ring-hydroxylating dioxygenase subunit alpha [Leptolyngbyaceae cyanobacterium MO_188.B28]